MKTPCNACEGTGSRWYWGQFGNSFKTCDQCDGTGQIEEVTKIEQQKII